MQHPCSSLGYFRNIGDRGHHISIQSEGTIKIMRYPTTPNEPQDHSFFAYIEKDAFARFAQVAEQVMEKFKEKTGALVRPFKVKIKNDLSMPLYLSVTEFKGVNYVHLRYFCEDWDWMQAYPRKQGVTFTVPEFEELTSLIPEIRASLV